MKNDVEQRPMDLRCAAVLDESKLCESIQENMRPWDGSTDHFRGSPLHYRWNRIWVAAWPNISVRNLPNRSEPTLSLLTIPSGRPFAKSLQLPAPATSADGCAAIGGAGEGW